ncbi:MAG: hypothetical protein LM566_05940, partial [Pyrobaculum sp.]|nr:hypothetical protein [Pyrobaculum sp.]
GKIKAEKYGDPQLIAQIKTTLENKLREALGDEYEQWKEYIKVKEGGKRLNNNTTTTPKTHPKPKHHQTTKRLKNTQKLITRRP